MTFLMLISNQEYSYLLTYLFYKNDIYGIYWIDSDYYLE